MLRSQAQPAQHPDATLERHARDRELPSHLLETDGAMQGERHGVAGVGVVPHLVGPLCHPRQARLGKRLAGAVAPPLRATTTPARYQPGGAVPAGERSDGAKWRTRP